MSSNNIYATNFTDYYTAVSEKAYLLGGMTKMRSSFSGVEAYRYGFNGKENDPEDGWQDYGMRMYNPKLSRFFSVDPITSEYPELTPYQFASDSPIENIDLDGLEKAKPDIHINVPVLKNPTDRNVKSIPKSIEGKHIDVIPSSSDDAWFSDIGWVKVIINFGRKLDAGLEKTKGKEKPVNDPNSSGISNTEANELSSGYEDNGVAKGKTKINPVVTDTKVDAKTTSKKNENVKTDTIWTGGGVEHDSKTFQVKRIFKTGTINGKKFEKDVPKSK